MQPEPAGPGTSATATPRRVAELRSRRHLVVPALATGGLAALALFGVTATRGFLEIENLLNILRAAAIIGIVALGMTFVTITGNFFSLSVAQTAAFAAVAFAGFLAAGIGLPLAFLAVLVLSVLIGLVQGAIVGRGANPIITTLGAGAALFGFTAVITSNKTIQITTDVTEALGRGRPLGIPNQTWLFLLLTVLGTIFLSRTRLGRQLYLVGANRAAARAAGISIATATLFAFAASAATAGLAGIMTAAQFRQGATNQFPDLTIPVVAAVLVGGTAVSGGEGSMLRTMLAMLGAVFIALLQNIMLLRQLETGWRLLLEGAIVAIAVSLYAVSRWSSR
jgi:simple sugar transport system permease protein/ribose transport system permease protein